MILFYLRIQKDSTVGKYAFPWDEPRKHCAYSWCDCAKHVVWVPASGTESPGKPGHLRWSNCREEISPFRARVHWLLSTFCLSPEYSWQQTCLFGYLYKVNHNKGITDTAETGCCSVLVLQLIFKECHWFTVIDIQNPTDESGLCFSGTGVWFFWLCWVMGRLLFKWKQ